MNEFQLANKDLYQNLLAQYKPTPVKPKLNDGQDPDLDTLIGVRIRPILPEEAANGHVAGVCARKSSTPIIDIHEFRQHVRRKTGLDTSIFTVDKVYGPDAQTDALYRDLVGPLIPWVWEGGVGTLFAHGHTGSGKTFTISELERMVATALMDGDLQGEREVHFCAFELAGILLLRKKIAVLEDSFGDTQLVGIVEEQPSSANELLSLIERSTTFRKTASTTSNDLSSRTHAVCRLRITTPSVRSAPEGILFLIDLAGSEAASDIAEHSAERMKETREINTSLSTLKDCIRARGAINMASRTGASMVDLQAAKKAHVPFRHTTLTKVLKHVFDPNSQRACRTILRYAQMLRVPAPPRKIPYNAKIPATWSNAQAREWIATNVIWYSSTDGMLLAPTENGSQLIRLDQNEFISRCARTQGVGQGHANAFYEKLWALHIDSRRITNLTASESGSIIPIEKNVELPFQKRLRTGMFVEARRSKINGGNETHRIVMIMSEGSLRSNRIICAAVAPATVKDAYEVNLQRHIAVSVEDMEEELSLEYDPVTRYYHLGN